MSFHFTFARENLRTFLKTLIFVFVLTAGVVYVQATWTDAPANPPSNNVDAPVNVGTIAQVKNGNLGVNNMSIFGQIQILGGAPAAGKVLTSDATGLASWQVPTVGAGISCPTGEAINTINADGTVVCIPAGGTASGPLTPHPVAISSNVNNYVLSANLPATFTNPVEVVVTINSGIVVGSNNVSTAAFRTGNLNLPPGSLVRIINNGRIQGMGGKGGNGGFIGDGQPGQNGGHAIELSHNVTIDNTGGNIWGGGGGGGGGADSGGGGGGGSGTNGGSGGPPGEAVSSAGAAGTWDAGGTGGPAFACGATTLPGGRGGNPGEAGNVGAGPNLCSALNGGAGGLAGYAIKTNGAAVSWIGGNTAAQVRGAIAP